MEKCGNGLCLVVGRNIFFFGYEIFKDLDQGYLCYFRVDKNKEFQKCIKIRVMDYYDLFFVCYFVFIFGV